MKLLAELKRRSVFKVGAAYVVIAWLVVQAASIAFPAFDAPPWVLRIFILVSLLGLPIALVFAWAFDQSHDGVKTEAGSRSDKAIFVVAAALVALAFAWFFLGQPADRADTPPRPQAVAAPAPPAPPPVNPQSIAVLPFVNMSADEDNEFFSDGISEELLNALARVDGLGVASRTSSFAYKDRELGASDIARQLKVRYILEGSVRKQDDQVRITAQLIDASDDRHVWAQSYDRQMTDIFEIQDDIANAIVAELRGTLGKQPGDAVSIRADTDNMQAYEKYLKARELFLTRNDLPESIRLFEQVTTMDPQFARGWEGLAAIYAIVEGWGYHDRDYTALSAAAARRALALDPSLSMPWAALALAEQKNRPVDWDQVLEMVDRAIAADPKNATALLWRSIAWINLGFFDRAIADQRACLAIDPEYANCERWLAAAHLDAGQDDQALALFERGVANRFVGSRSISFVPLLVERGDRLAALLLLDGLQAPLGLQRELLASLQQPKRPVADAEALLARHGVTAAGYSGVPLTREHALLWLGAFDLVAAEDAGADDTVIAWEPRPAGWRNSPAFKRLLVKLGVPTYWRKHGFPPQCRAVGASDFSCDAPGARPVK